MTVTVTSKGQVTVPKQVRDRLGIKPGSKVDFEVAEDGRAFLRRVGKRTVKPSRFERMRAPTRSWRSAAARVDDLGRHECTPRRCNR
jgi:antitoxin PrlF